MIDLSDIDWFIWEDVETAHIFEGDEAVPMRNEHWNSIAIAKDHWATANIIVGVGRSERALRVLKVDTPCTVRVLITKIHDFYATPITQELLDDAEYDSWDYKKQVEERMKKGEIVNTYELNGSTYVFNDEQNCRRCPLLCSGNVRFEGVSYDPRHNVHFLHLGS